MRAIEPRPMLTAISGVVLGIALVLSCQTGPSPSRAQAPCSGTCTVNGPIAVKEPVEVKGTVGVNGPVTVQGSVAVTSPVSVHGSVALDGPVSVQGPLRVITAETDSSRLISETGILHSRETVAAGPLVLTGFTDTSGSPLTGSAAELFIDDVANCPASTPPVLRVPKNAVLSGLRILVPAGKFLCARDVVGFVSYGLSGFRPY